MSQEDREWLNKRIEAFLADPSNTTLLKASAYANLEAKKKYAAELEATIEKRILVLARQRAELKNIQKEISVQAEELKKIYGE